MSRSAADAVTTPPVRGTVILEPGNVRLQRAVILVLTLGPFAGLIAAIASLWGRGIGAGDVSLLATTYVFFALGITVGYHRLLTHRSFEAPSWLRVVFAVLGSMAIEGSVIGWVADHRRHHAYADKEGDPHSPHLQEREGLVGTVKGLWHAHVGWMLAEERTELQRWAPDLLKDPAMRRVDRLFPVLALFSLLLPAVVGFALTSSWSGALSAFLWGGLVRVFVLHHVTWSVNSICHYFGTRPFETTDLSTNNWPLALLSLGESWHNNHHAFPTSAIHGVGRFQLDLSGAVIVGLERAGIARNVRRPSDKQLAGKKS
ncbi:MAG: acyl-CoA desaturase [Actinomycetota bacterium]